VEQIAPEYWAILQRTYHGIGERDLRAQEALLKRQLANLEEQQTA
jgi:hypothetical protein